jgi:hypothetical protein
MWKVTNKMKDVRKFRDGYIGKDILVESKKSTLTKSPPEEGEVWKVEEIEEKKEEIVKPLKEEDKK